MGFKGIGVYHVGLGGIEKPGDFGYRIDVIDGVDQWQFVQWCSKFGVCFIKIHRNIPDEKLLIWQWDGNVEKPTIYPSIKCEDPRRCGQHVNVVEGIIK